jgi:ribose 5-phosphate isomerase A
MKSEKYKRAAGISAASLVEDGMIVGLGTGSTARYSIIEIGRRMRREGMRVKGIPTSSYAMKLAKECRIPITNLERDPWIDLAIDGADQVDGKLNLIKGGWGAHTMEKIVASSAERFIVVVDESKMTPILSKPVPLEVIPEARNLVAEMVKSLGGSFTIRRRKAESGNYLVNSGFGEIEEPCELGRKLSCIPGIVEHGIFPSDMVTEVHVGKKDGVKIYGRRNLD